LGILTTCKPRADVLAGDLKDAIFAADFGDVVSGHAGAPDVYRDPQLSFRNTHPARDLVCIVREVFGALANTKEPGLALRLSTGFGGGKTHTLLSLWHLAGNVAKTGLGTELLPAAGRPKQVHVAAVHVAAVDGAKAGHPIFAQHGGVVVKSLAGELAYQLGGAAAVTALGATDDVAAQPTEAAISHVKFKAKFKLPFTLLADTDHVVCEMYGVLKEKSMYGRKYMGVERSTFIIDAKGKLVREFRKVSADGHADMIAALLAERAS